jgi:hypothetical protein
VFVAGNAIFTQPSYADAIARIRREAVAGASA